MEMKVCLNTLIEGKDGVTFTHMHAHALPIKGLFKKGSS